MVAPCAASCVPPIGLTAFSRQPWMGRLRAERRQTVKDGCHLSLMLNTATGPHYRGRQRRRMTGKLKKKRKKERFWVNEKIETDRRTTTIFSGYIVIHKMTLGKGKHYDKSTSLASSHEINCGDIFILITYLKKLKNIYLMVIYNSFVAQASWLIYFGAENRIANISNSKWLKI